MKNMLLLSAGGVKEELPLPVMTVIALLLLMLPYLIYRYTGKSVTEWLRLSVLIRKAESMADALRETLFGKKSSRKTTTAKAQKPASAASAGVKALAKPADRSLDNRNRSVQRDYLRFLSRLLDHARKNRLFAIVPGNLNVDGQTAQLAGILVTRSRVIAVMAYAFGGQIRCGKDGNMQVQEGGSFRPIGDPSSETLEAENLVKKAAARIGVDPDLVSGVMVFTGEDAVLLNGCPANAKTQDTFFSEFLTSADTGGDTLVPSDIGKKLALLRGKKR